ncbi:MAG: ABC transporter permease subunit [Acidimicrobiaceae bacterium]|nr:ABC transporter permease subunit [Acidimicrobiaceae bacterium]
MQSAKEGHHDLFTLHHANWLTRLWRLEMPGAMPAFLTGMRIAAGGCVIGAVVGDFFFRQGEIGLGRLIDNYQKDTRIPELFTATIVACLFGIAIFLIVGWISNRTLKHWHESARNYT